MTTVAFHFNVSDRLDYACRLARKALAAGASTVVLADADTLDRIDRALWLTSATDFLAHCRDTAAPGVVTRSPLLLASCLQPALQGEVLLNLSEAVPMGYEAFSRVIEVVGVDEQERHSARQRWRHYTAAGLELIRFDAQNRMTPT